MAILLLRSSAPAASGSLLFTGGSSTSSSPTVRILRTGAIDVNTFTIEMWLRTSGTNNGTVTDTTTYGGNATDANIIWDGDSLDSRGFILGIGGGLPYLGVNAASARTAVGSTDIRDGQWHHVAWYRNSATGLMEIHVDGARERTVTGPTGSVQYDGNAPTTDSYHYLAKEKLNLTLGFAGYIGPIRVSSNQRYSGATYTVPTSMWTEDANTIALYSASEGSETTLNDSVGGFDGELLNSPTWSAGPF